MTPTKVSVDATIAVTRNIEHIAINERLVSVRVTQSGVLQEPTKIGEKRFSSFLSGSKSEMIMTPSNLKKMIAGNAYATEDLHAVTDAFLESARTKGYVRAIELHGKEFTKDKPSVFERLEAGESLHMVRFDYGSHMLFDDEGGVLPTGLYYDYMNGNLRNGAYDLAKTIAVLSKLPDVRTIDGKPLAVKDVPYYNISSGCASFLEFIYAPTLEQMAAIWAKAKSRYMQYPSTVLHEAAFELDIMGLRKAGAALGKTYYACTSDEDEDNDDDIDSDEDHDRHY